MKFDQDDGIQYGTIDVPDKPWWRNAVEISGVLAAVILVIAAGVALGEMMYFRFLIWVH